MTLSIPAAALLRPVPLLMLLLWLGGCAIQPRHTLEIDPQHPLTAQTLLTDVPFHAQDDYQCGPAALAMLLNQRGIEATPEQLTERVWLPERRGSLQLEMVAAAREQGLLVYPLEPRPEALLLELQAGNPVLVLQNLGFNWWPQWHYAVAIGYDLPRQQIILHSGLEAERREPLRLFLRSWQGADNWARVLMPPEQLPASAEALPWLRAASDLELSGQPAAARSAYTRAIQQWPEQPAGWFGAANSAWQLGLRQAAIEGYLETLRQFPNLQQARHNLIKAFTVMGCPQQAKLASEPDAVNLLQHIDLQACREPYQPSLL